MAWWSADRRQGGADRAHIRDRPGIKADLARVHALFPRLAERAPQMAGTPSGGEQQMLSVGRALMSRSKLLLLDEPSMGLSPILVRDIFRVLWEINAALAGDPRVREAYLGG